jgi:tRNA pseudouridine55 synthase
MNGVLNILKPPGMTSHDVVAYVRKITGIKKIGHTGTLDPGAAGVLPLCIGKATKIVDFIMNDKKTYICELTLGNRTDTYDKYGKFIYDQNRECNHVTEEGFKETLKAFMGDILQTPPAYSAVKIAGKRSYELAREGSDVILPQRQVTIYEIDILSFDIPRIMLKIQCSKGTYIRSICNDIGEKLNCGAYMSFLLRTQTGNFTLSNSHLLQELSSENFHGFILDADFALSMKEIFIDEKFTRSIMNGNSLKLPNEKNINGELVKVYIKPHKFVAIGRISSEILHIEKLLI